MPPLSNCLTLFAPSRIGQVFNLAAKLKSEGRTIYDLSSGEPDFDTDPAPNAAAHAAIDEGYTKYTEVDGSPDMKAAIRRKFVSDGHGEYPNVQLAVGNGAKPLIANILQALLNPGDDVLIPGPCWTSHPGMVQVLGAKAVIVPCTADNDYKPLPDDLRAAITPATRAIILCSPSNPTGAVLSDQEMRAIMDVLADYPDIWNVSDEIYSDITFDGCSPASAAVVAPELIDRIITVNGVSKGYAMTGWRIGYAAGPEDAMVGLRKLMSQVAGSPSSISQAAAIAALDGPQESVALRRDEYQSRRDSVLRALGQIEELRVSKPQGAFYVFVDCAGATGKKTPDGKTIESSADLTTYFLEHAGVAVVPGEAFESEKSFRLSFATSVDVLEGACDGITKSCRDLT